MNYSDLRKWEGIGVVDSGMPTSCHPHRAGYLPSYQKRLHRMDDISHTTLQDMYLLERKSCSLIKKISLKSVPEGTIGNKSALVQGLALCPKPLPKPMMGRFTDIYRSLSPNNIIMNHE